MIGYLNFSIDYELDPVPHELDNIDLNSDYKDELRNMRASFISDIDKAAENYVGSLDVSDKLDGYPEVDYSHEPDDLHVSINFDESRISKEKVEEILLGFKLFLKPITYWEYLTVYGDMIYRGSLYEPPEYAESEYKVTYHVYWIDDKVEFED